jgi:hypothetical protein
MNYRLSVIGYRLLAVLVLLLAVWQVARAEAPIVSHPAQVQLAQMMPALIDSEAEHASGAYIPGVGAVVTLDLLRGPNATPGKPAAAGVRDWLLYLVQTFGPQLEAVPPDEIITFSVQFYDYDSATYQQLVIVSRAAEVSDPAQYEVWLNGQPYTEGAIQP